jgi:serine/threonine-protein kinase
MVVAATHLELHTLRAIKLMLPHALRHARAAKCFLQEAWTACALESEHVARVHDVGQHGDVPFMVMEYLEGSDLGALLEQRKVLPVREAALYALEICDALAEAHALGVVHRDIKPENIFIARRRDGGAMVKVLDFGLAKVAAAAFPVGERTPKDALVGSPSFMSPEQIQGDRDLDPRSDIWSIGVLLYRMITSQLPFRPPGRVGLAPLLAAILKSAPVPPSQLMPSLPAGLEPVILRCLEKDPSRRYASIAELAVALAPFAPVDGARLVARIRGVQGHAVDVSGFREGELSCAPEAPPSPPPSPLPPRLLALPGADEALRAAESTDGPGTLSSAAWTPLLPSSVPPPQRRQRTRSVAVIAATAAAFAIAGAIGVEAQRGEAALSPAVAEAGVAHHAKAIAALVQVLPQR